MENKCVVCGAIIPEGRQVCPNCEMNDKETIKAIENFTMDDLVNEIEDILLGGNQ